MNTTKKMSTLPHEVEVLVVGFGPVGAALSALLGRYGVETLTVDRVTDILMMPRAIALDNEALRILQMAGLDENAFAKIGIPEVKMNCPVVGQFGKANTAGSLDGHPKLVTFYQPDLERALRKKVAEFPQVSFRGGFELVAVTSETDGIVAELKDWQDQVHQVRARYLVGADGAHSKVRSLINQDFKGQTYGEDWLIVDAYRRKGKVIDHVEFNCDSSRPAPHMPAPGGRERWEFMLHPDEAKEDMETPERIAELLPPEEDLEIERQAVYRFHARCCERFQAGRIFLAGDAAHITPPFVGQGLVAGLRDAANLGWKMAWVLRGDAKAELLESYDTERRPHARKMINLARLMGKLVMPRNKLSAALIHGTMRLAGLVPPLRYHLEELRIKPANSFDNGFFKKRFATRALRPGTHLPQGLVRTESGVLLSDSVLGDQFLIVGFGVDPIQTLDADLLDHWKRTGGKCLQIGVHSQPPGQSEHFMEDLTNTFCQNGMRGNVAVIRPDKVIMASGPLAHASLLVREALTMMGNRAPNQRHAASV
ncbi:bifunctional 3-(3-hydroxy-phenyl)propionate/3-hydroxycinnamic acid hydroxylase [Marinobacter sp. CHS3-4]|uniref:bifunctional 3-(3-hydroxy-phenyl)propionate/3-hydroxycinnamic acid hydroxylase n=1 Tax=Marinobacter sp. CHS3-4 TaxID=3045174 RepID=UPI0024B4FA24|nr:bifunctional 3-(3-hydroxy-phenyl)propionate/3-hydroxycinnamic acid hydroxylase [Marinobacter sp. CHS3-4]MDI9244626.1 bifunctional 3-(3-hydroxy-phenyl)propionate/3-hydroxycinnamic acid hydroxylase [Marinobacter sp. CHS3-4]